MHSSNNDKAFSKFSVKNDSTQSNNKPKKHYKSKENFKFFSLPAKGEIDVLDL